jgi:hypothetical protein
MVVVQGVGLEVEQTKTSVSSTFGTLNSTLLRWRKERLVVEHTFRFGMLRKPDYLNCLGKSFEKFVGKTYGSKRKNTRAWNAANVFLTAHKGQISGISLDKLGFRGAMAARLAKLYNLLPQSLQEHDLPPPPNPHNVQLNRDLVVDVPEKDIGPDLAIANSDLTREWRWSIHFRSSDLKQLRKTYRIKVDSLRDLQRCPLPRLLYKRKFFSETIKIRQVWKSLLDSDEVPRYDPLSWLIEHPPSYMEALAGEPPPWFVPPECMRKYESDYK